MAGILSPSLVCLTVLLTVFCGESFGYIEYPGPRYVPTKGEIWPKPQKQAYHKDVLSFSMENFKIEVAGNNTCPVLNAAILRYYELIMEQWPQLRRARRPTAERRERGRPREAPLTALYVFLTEPCQQWPSLEMKEDYVLHVGSPSVPEGSGHLVSASLWGVLRGLESFSQMLYANNNEMGLKINSTSIEDFPRFPHRGLLLDTSRHFISMRVIRAILDGMVYNKLNVFHWHIVDDHSFPYESKVYPTLSQKGAYHPRLVYSQANVAEIVEYARVRGIRVMPEYDTPGHTRSWGEAFPEILTACYGPNGKPNGDLGPINPTEPSVYTFIKNLFTEVTNVFPDRFLHLGGDEVGFECWQSNPSIKEYMSNNSIATFSELEEVYIQKIVDIADELQSQSVVWQEVYLNGVRLPNGTVVHVWTGNQRELLQNITGAGYPALLSTCWYLDHLANGGDWEKYYKCDPRDFIGTETQKNLVMGGEACMWSEVVDDNNVLTRIFPRVSAAAEKLWSSEDVTDVADAKHRIEEHTCRMIARDIPAQPPSAPGFCLAVFD